MQYVLGELAGYVILLGIGLFFALAVLLAVRIETRWLGTKKTFEWFSTAGRTIKTGLLITSVVSAWTWAATLLQSSTVAYQYGISGPFWYAAGASIQVILFGILAIELKRKAPMTHTFPELINARFGKTPHKIFLSFAFMTNTIVTSMLILGGAAVIQALTGINVFVASFLIPIGIVIYTLFGGLKATFYAEYLNTALIFGIVLVFTSVVYFGNTEIGGISGMYDKLSTSSTLKPIPGNAMGVYLTMASMGALAFGIINIIGNFGTVFVDQSYWQRAIASKPKSVVPGFVIGGLAWFAIPFALATTLGLSAIALNMDISAQQVESGLVAPLTATKLFGDVGAIVMISVLFTAVTAAGAAQLTSVSSLITYDVYRTYIKPSSSGRELMRISRMAILGFGLGMGILSSILFVSGISLQYLYLAMGVFIGSAVAPISLAILWKKTNRNAATVGALAGLVIGISSWLTVSYVISGQISLASTSNTISLLVGNTTSILSSLAIVMTGSLMRSEKFNFEQLRHKIIVYDEKIRARIEQETNDATLKKSSRSAILYGLLISLVILILIPVPLFVLNYVFTKSFFSVWIFAVITCVIAGAATVWLLPIIQSRHSIQEVFLRSVGAQKYETELEPSPTNDEFVQKILVAIDGSATSVRCLNYVNFTLRDISNVQVYIAHIIEWSEDDEGVDEETVSKIQEQGKIMIQSVVVPARIRNHQRLVRLGDPAKKIAELAKSLNIDTIVMGKRGLGNAENLGHVPAELLQITSKAVVLLD